MQFSSGTKQLNGEPSSSIGWHLVFHHISEFLYPRALGRRIPRGRVKTAPLQQLLRGLRSHHILLLYKVSGTLLGIASLRVSRILSTPTV